MQHIFHLSYIISVFKLRHLGFDTFLAVMVNHYYIWSVMIGNYVISILVIIFD